MENLTGGVQSSILMEVLSMKVNTKGVSILGMEYIDSLQVKNSTDFLSKGRDMGLELNTILMGKKSQKEILWKIYQKEMLHAIMKMALYIKDNF